MAQSCPTLCIPMNHSTTGLPVHRELLESYQICVHRVSGPSNHLILCHPLPSCPHSFPASGSFPMSQLFPSDGQSIGVNTTNLLLLVTSLSHARLFTTSWTVVYKAPLSMELSRQEYWSGLPFPSPGDLPNPGIEPRSPALRADALPSEPPGKPSTCHKYNCKWSHVYILL